MGEVQTASRVQKIEKKHNANCELVNYVRLAKSLTQLFKLQLKYFDAKYCKCILTAVSIEGYPSPSSGLPKKFSPLFTNLQSIKSFILDLEFRAS